MDNQQGPKRLNKIASELNVGVNTLMEYLRGKGFTVENANSKIDDHAYNELLKVFQSEKSLKQQSLSTLNNSKKESIAIDAAGNTIVEPVEKQVKKEEKKEEPLLTSSLPGLKILGKIDIDAQKKAKKSEPEETVLPEIKQEAEENIKEPVSEPEIKTEIPELKPEITESIKVEVPVNEPKVIGKIDLSSIDNSRSKDKKNKRQEPQHKEEAASKEKNEKKPEAKIDLKPETDEITPAEPDVISVNEKEPVVVNQTPAADTAPANEGNAEDFIKTEIPKLSGVTLKGTIDLSQFNKPEKKATGNVHDNRNKDKKRPRIHKDKVVKVEGNDKLQDNKPQGGNNNQQKQGAGNHNNHGGNQNSGNRNRFNNNNNNNRNRNAKLPVKQAPTDEEIQNQIKETLAKMQSKPKFTGAKHRRNKRDLMSQHQQELLEQSEAEKNILQVTEFLTANELANLMGVQVTDVIKTCLGLGLFVSINQRLDAETITIVADEFGYDVKFISADDQNENEDTYVSDPEVLKSRNPVVTVMGHVDHGKTSLLDYIRKANVVAGEAGGITQHIGAYEVALDNGRKITFLDTPGHEAFTAMRARGAKITDIAIIVIAADDQIMPQTIEAINHAKAAAVPMIFAINKIDKPGANPEKIREQLANMNLLVEEWGGKYQSQEIAAKHGVNVDKLLEKILLEADLLDLKADYTRPAVGTVIESSLDKGRGYVTNVLIHEGIVHIGDIVLSGIYYGRVKAMFNERNQPIKEAGPSKPVQILGLSGASQAGEKITVHLEEKDAKERAFKRNQLMREQALRTTKHITLDEIGRRIAIGDFKELNIIVKADVDGSVEAMADSLLKLSTENIQVTVIHKGVGGITESDVLLATASNAIIVGFQVRPTVSARKLAETEQIQIKTYSIIYQAIEEVKAAIEGMLEPKIEEKVLGNVEVREVFKISKLGNIAGCVVLDGKITRSSRIRVLRNGIVVHTGTLFSLRRFKDEVKEVIVGQDCGVAINNFNDIRVDDNIEAFEEVEVKRKM